MEPRQILIVDDDPEDRAIIKEAMEMIQNGDVIFFAENGEQALDLLNRDNATNELPCLVVLDLNMPKMNGTETLRNIRSKEAFNNIPVVIYSTSVNPVEKERCLQLGAQDYITKPISFEESKVTAQRFLALCSPNSRL